MQAGRTGLFGKLPAHADFVHRLLPRSFIAPWDAWLSDGILAAQPTLVERYAAAWETAPAWRFRLAPGVCGPDAALGVMLTSADQVGRRFPLTLVALQPMAVPPPAEEWFVALESAARAGRDGALDADQLVAALPALPDEDDDATLDGRSLFWSAAGTQLTAMPPASLFHLMLGAGA